MRILHIVPSRIPVYNRGGPKGKVKSPLKKAVKDILPPEIITRKKWDSLFLLKTG